MAEPLPLCYLNGSYLPLARRASRRSTAASSSRDGVYEVMPVYARAAVPLRRPPGRLTRSLGALRMEDPHTRPEWRALLGTLIERNGGGDQYVYWQVTRGAERGRTHAPLPDIPRTVFAFCAPLPPTTAETLERRRRVRHRAKIRAGRAATSSRWRCSPTCCCASSRSTPAPPRPSCCATAS